MNAHMHNSEEADLEINEVAGNTFVVDGHAIPLNGYRQKVWNKFKKCESSLELEYEWADTMKGI